MAKLKRAKVAKTDIPDLSQIKARALQVYADRDAMIDEMRALRFMENDPSVPAGMEAEIVRSPIAWQVIERMTGTLTVEKPVIHIPPRDQNEASKVSASNMEIGTTALLREMERQADDDVWERFIESLLADGWGCMRLMYAPQVWGGYPAREKDEDDKAYNKRVDEWVQNSPIPINWSWVDPKTVYPFWSEVGLDHVLEIDERDPISLGYDRFNVLHDQYSDIEIQELTRQHRDGGTVEFAQLWTHDTLTYWVNGEVVHHVAHNYTRPPYIIARGITTSSSESDKMGLSILYPVRYILPYLDRLLSQKATAVRMWCWPTPIFRTSESSFTAEGEERSIEVRPGKSVTLRPGEDLSFLVWNGNAPDIERQVGQVMDMIDRATISQVMYGESYAGDSGYLVNQLIAAARMKFRPLVAHAERAHEQMVQLLWDIVEHQIGRPLYVYAHGDDQKWISLDPDDIRGYRQVRVTVNPLLPTDTYARTSRVLAELNGGVRSRRSAMEEIGIEQPDRMMDEITLDQWLQQPEVQQVLTGEILTRYGVLRQMKERKISGADMLQLLPTMPPALQQAILGGAMGGAPSVPGMGQMPMMPNQGTPGIFAAPGVQAVPAGPNGPPAGGLGVRPSGVSTGMPSGPRMTGGE